jgi:hypothetical protein
MNSDAIQLPDAPGIDGLSYKLAVKTKDLYYRLSHNKVNFLPKIASEK